MTPSPSCALDESAFQVRVVPNPDADAIRADVPVYNERKKDAQALLDSTLRDDPSNALAHETMGYLKFREGDLQDARKWYGEAVKLDSQSYLAHYYYATMSMGHDGSGKDSDIESSLRTSIKLNPAFAPAYDALAMYYSSDPAKDREAHLLNLQAISLEPGNLNYGLNTAAVLMNEHQYDNAVGVLREAIHVAQTPAEVISVQTRIDQIQQYQAAMAATAQAEGASGTHNQATVVSDTRTMTISSSDGGKLVLRPDTPQRTTKYPTEAPTGQGHTAKGVLRNVHCTYPTVLTLSVDQAGRGSTVSLYRNDFSQIEFTSANFAPAGDLNPCTDIESIKPELCTPKFPTSPSTDRSSLWS